MSTDRTYDDVPSAIITSVLANLSIIVTTIPFMKPVLDSLHTGILASDLRSMGGLALFRSTSYPLQAFNKKTTNFSKNLPSTWQKNNRNNVNIWVSTGDSTDNIHECQAEYGLEDVITVQRCTTVAVQREDDIELQQNNHVFGTRL